MPLINCVWRQSRPKVLEKTKKGENPNGYLFF